MGCAYVCHQPAVDFLNKSGHRMHVCISHSISFPHRGGHNTHSMTHTVFRYISLILLLVAVLEFAAAKVSAQGDDTRDRLSTAQIRNIFLQADGLGGGIPMADGLSQETNANGEVIATYQIINPIALGNLNGDDAGDAAMVLLAIPADGSPVTYSLHAVLNNNGEVERVAFAVLENAVRVLNLAIRDGQIVVDMIKLGENDPECCPATPVRQIYQLQPTGAFDLIDEMSFEEAELPFAFDNELTRDELANLTYPETFDFSALDLVDGEYSYTLDEHMFSYELLDNIVYGDLTGDGLDEAVVLVQYSFDGEPAIKHMYVVINDRGMPLIAGWRDYSRFTGGQIESITIEDGVLAVEFTDLTHNSQLTETMVIEMEALVTVE